MSADPWATSLAPFVFSSVLVFAGPSLGSIATVRLTHRLEDRFRRRSAEIATAADPILQRVKASEDEVKELNTQIAFVADAKAVVDEAMKFASLGALTQSLVIAALGYALILRNVASGVASLLILFLSIVAAIQLQRAVDPYRSWGPNSLRRPAMFWIVHLLNVAGVIVVVIRR